MPLTASGQILIATVLGLPVWVGRGAEVSALHEILIPATFSSGLVKAP